VGGNGASLLASSQYRLDARGTRTVVVVCPRHGKAAALRSQVFRLMNALILSGLIRDLDKTRKSHRNENKKLGRWLRTCVRLRELKQALLVTV
jgi:hypothetical protein